MEARPFVDGRHDGRNGEHVLGCDGERPQVIEWIEKQAVLEHHIASRPWSCPTRTPRPRMGARQTRAARPVDVGDQSLKCCPCSRVAALRDAGGQQVACLLVEQRRCRHRRAAGRMKQPIAAVPDGHAERESKVRASSTSRWLTTCPRSSSHCQGLSSSGNAPLAGGRPLPPRDAIPARISCSTPPGAFPRGWLFQIVPDFVSPRMRCPAVVQWALCSSGRVVPCRQDTNRVAKAGNLP